MFVERESPAPEIVQAPELIMSQNYSYHAVRNLRIYGTEKCPFFTVELEPHCCLKMRIVAHNGIWWHTGYNDFEKLVLPINLCVEFVLSLHGLARFFLYIYMYVNPFELDLQLK